ncbi:MAG: cytochrome c biogenesis protein CcsA [Phycisphaerae bacterium]
MLLLAPALAHAAPPAFKADAKLVALDSAVDWSEFRLLAVQHAGRYKAFGSYSREMMSALIGGENLPGLTPYASTLEWLFNKDAYNDVEIIRVKDVGIRMHLSAHLEPETRQRIRDTGYMTPREFLSDTTVTQRMNELMGRGRLRAAMGRVANAHEAATDMEMLTRIIPRPDGNLDKPWFSAVELLPLLVEKPESPQAIDAAETLRQAGFTPQLAVAAMAPWASLRKAWLERDSAGVQEALNRLAALMPTFGKDGAYPSASQREAEARYYAMGKFAFGWVTYFIGMLAAVWALVTNWRTPRWAALVLLIVGIALHAYGLALRWYILDRIPVANMFEAVVASAWAGILLALLLELFLKTGVFMVAAHAAGFTALIMASYVLPGGGTITTIQMILDDVMLRIHTTLIISSYALIFIGAVIALCYLFGYYFTLHPERSTEMGVIAAFSGAAMWMVSLQVFTQTEGVVDNAAGYLKNAQLAWTFAGTAGAAAIASLILWRMQAPVPLLGAAIMLFVSSASVAIGSRGFVQNTSLTFLFGGLAWSAATSLGHWARSRQPALVGAGGPMLATPMGRFSASELIMQRPILAGAAPGDEGKGERLPRWLHDFDWSHLIILNLVFVMLFVGIILGAIWADYSWGRPWGWDPKEVFALNTWIIYAILIHSRFLVKEKGIWTAWLSIGGCLMMLFNWIYVNFFLVGLHSYA